jgi:hypothetical protein
MAHAYLSCIDGIEGSKECEKVPYETQREAKRVMGKLGRSTTKAARNVSVVQFGVGFFRPYKCKKCFKWHLGHTREIHGKR